MTSNVTGPARLSAIVVGAGIVGTSVAAHLAKLGAQTTLIERADIAAGTTANSFAWLNSNDKGPASYHELNVLGMAEHRSVSTWLEQGGGYSQSGNLEWSEVGREHLLEARIDRLTALEYPVRRLSIAEAAALEPDLRREALTEPVAYFPSEGWVDVHALTRSLLRWGQSSGQLAVLTRQEIVGTDVRGDRVLAARSSTGEQHRADVFIVCTGHQAAQDIGVLGTRPPMRNRPGLVLIADSCDAGPRRVIHGAGLSLRPHRSQGVFLHSYEIDARLEESQTASGISKEWLHSLLAEAAARYPALARSAWRYAGVSQMPIPADGLPVVGRSPHFENAFVAVMHSGVTLGPLIGRLLATEIVEESRSPLLAGLGIERFFAIPQPPDHADVALAAEPRKSLEGVE